MAINRFDFEEQIMLCWNITKDLQDLNEEILEGNLTKDQISNIIVGIEELYEIRFRKLLRTLEQFVHHDAIKYSVEET